VQNQIEVERARRARVRTLAAEMLFGGEKPGEDRMGRECRAARRGRVEEARLTPDTDGSGVMERRGTQVVDPGGQPLQRLAKNPFPIAEVAAERDGDI